MGRDWCCLIVLAFYDSKYVFKHALLCHHKIYIIARHERGKFYSHVRRAEKMYSHVRKKGKRWVTFNLSFSCFFPFITKAFRGGELQGGTAFFHSTLMLRCERFEILIYCSHYFVMTEVCFQSSFSSMFSMPPTVSERASADKEAFAWSQLPCQSVLHIAWKLLMSLLRLLQKSLFFHSSPSFNGFMFMHRQRWLYISYNKINLCKVKAENGMESLACEHVNDVSLYNHFSFDESERRRLTF